MKFGLHKMYKGRSTGTRHVTIYFSVKILQSMQIGSTRSFEKFLENDEEKKLCAHRSFVLFALFLLLIKVLMSASMSLFIIIDYKTLFIQNITVLYLLKKHARIYVTKILLRK